MSLTEPLRKNISDLVTHHPAILFMKGSRRLPQCGFSAKVVQILDELSVDYETIDVLSSPELREGIKEFSQWPTIPQFYFKGSFIGGCDIIREMYASGELQQLLGVVVAEPEVPTITITTAAERALREASADVDGDCLRMDIDPQFNHDLYFGPPAPGDVEVTAGDFPIHIDRASARRANRVQIDFVAGSNGGFRITNPNQPRQVKQLSAAELKTLLDRGEVMLFDVRSEQERAIAKIDRARALEGKDREHLFSLKTDTPIALHCHHGIRSQQAAEQLLREGFTNVFNLVGGIDAWSMTVDPTVPRY